MMIFAKRVYFLPARIHTIQMIEQLEKQDDLDKQPSFALKNFYRVLNSDATATATTFFCPSLKYHNYGIP